MAKYSMIRVEDALFLLHSGQAQSWTEARGTAQALGMDLASIHSAAENAAITARITEMAWIGLEQAPGSEEPAGGWAWVDGTALDYLNWLPGEPNDYQGETWGHLYLNGTWNDLDSFWTISSAVYRVSAGQALTLTGLDGADLLLGGDLGDTISGGAGKDTIAGGAGADVLSSGGGGGVITGGAGADLITGGVGRDVFVFEQASDSYRATADRIRYFNDRVDRLDFHALSDDLHLSATGTFHHEAGEIVLRQQTGALTRLQVLLDVDGDGAFDLNLYLVGTHHLTAANFGL